MAKVHVPHLEKKLEALMRRSTEVKTYSALAGRLISRKGEALRPTNIRVWITGSEIREPEHVPDAHVATICQILDLTDERGNPRLDVFLEPEWAEFEQQIQIVPTYRLPWRKLLLQAQVRPEFKVVPDDAVRGASYNVEEETDYPLIRINERVRLHLEMSSAWALRCSEDRAVHLMLFIEDVEKLAGFPPSHDAESAYLEVKTGALTIPGPHSQGPRITGPAGLQAFYALLTDRRLPPVLSKGVLTPDRQAREDVFTAMVEELQNTSRPYQWALWKSPFIAYYG